MTSSRFFVPSVLLHYDTTPDRSGFVPFGKYVPTLKGNGKMKTGNVIPIQTFTEAYEAEQWNVYYRNRETGRLCRYCVSPMDYTTATQVMKSFNERYPDKRYPNGKGWYPFSQAWIDYH